MTLFTLLGMTLFTLLGMTLFTVLGMTLFSALGMTATVTDSREARADHATKASQRL